METLRIRGTAILSAVLSMLWHLGAGANSHPGPAKLFCRTNP